MVSIVTVSCVYSTLSIDTAMWKKDTADSLRKEIKELCEVFKRENITLNILIVGDTYDGKSSIINTFNKALSAQKE